MPISSLIDSAHPSQPNPPFFDINGISYISPTVPVLLQILSGAKRPQDLLPSEQVFLVPKNKLIEVNIPGTGAHPFHCMSQMLRSLDTSHFITSAWPYI